MRILVRTATVVAGLLYIAVAGWNYHATWLFDHPTSENLALGVRLHGRNPELWSAYARAVSMDDPGRSLNAFQKAAALNPFEAGNWEQIAFASVQTGESQKAEAAFRTAVAAVPFSPSAAWKLANFLLLEQREAEAIPYLRTAAAQDASLRIPVFDIAWKVLDSPGAILRDLVPAELKVREDYLRYLIGKNKLHEAYDAWKEIRPAGGSSVAELGNLYVDSLTSAGLGDEAARVWDEILTDTGRASMKASGELITNGDFESDPVNDGLDWRFTPGPGYEIALDNFVWRQGSRALRVVFDGTANPDFRAVWQRVPVAPNHDYRLRGYMKTENITTDNGLRFCVSAYAAPPGEHFEQCTEGRVGDNGWHVEQLAFRTKPGIHVVTVSLNRPVSSKLNNLLRGKVWIDAVSLQDAGK